MKTINDFCKAVLKETREYLTNIDAHKAQLQAARAKYNSTLVQAAENEFTGRCILYTLYT